MPRLSNLFSRTPKEKPSVELIHPKLQLPPDGTYPPRLLVPGCSIWLKEGVKVDLGKGLTVEARDGACYLYQTDVKHQFYLNGQFLPPKITLKDGDFIHNKRTKMVFQQDPVADYRKLLETTPIELQPFAPSEHLRKHVQVNEQGLSINGNVNFVRWDDLLYMAVVSQQLQLDIGLVPTHLLKELTLKRLENLRFHNWSDNKKAKKLTLSAVEFHQLAVWIEGFAPFDVSCAFLPRNAGVDSAYHNTVFKKIIGPAEKTGTRLPATREFMLDQPTTADRVKIVVFGIVVLLVCSFFITLTKYPEFNPIYCAVVMFCLSLPAVFAAIGGLIGFIQKPKQRV